MGILKIAKMGHPALSKISGEVDDPASPDIKNLVKNMILTMNDAKGIGLAAPQVHEPIRLVIFQVPHERFKENDKVSELTVLINPKIVFLSEDKEDGVEACLSLPGMMGIVPRFTHIRYSGFNLDGEYFEREARDYHARVVQHECDHLDGILYPMRMVNLTSFGYTEELQKDVKQNSRENS